MSKGNNSKIFLATILLVFAFCLHNPIGASATVVDVLIDGMSGFSIVGDDKVWLDIQNENIFGKEYPEMASWASANDWRFATHAEFMELLGALVPTYLYSSATYAGDEGHFSENEAIIMGANDIPGGPEGEIQYFTAFIGEAYNERHIGVFEEDDGMGNFFHSYWGVDDHPDLGSIIYYGYESALLIKVTNGQPVPEPSTMLLIGAGLIGLAGFRRKSRKK